MNNTSRPEIETVVGDNGDVVVERELNRVATGIVGAVEIRSTAGERVRVHVTDEFPAGLPIELAAFRPNSKPDAGSITADGARIAQTVDTEPVTIEYGIKLTDSSTEVAFDPPVVQGVEPVTGGHISYPDGGEQSSANSDQPEVDTDASRSHSSTVLNLDDEETDGESVDPGTAESLPVDDTETTDEASRDAVAGDAERPADGTASEPLYRGAGTQAGDEPTNDRLTRGAQTTDTPSGPAVDPGGGGDQEPAFEEAGQDASGTRDRATEDVPRSLELRIDRLSARVEEFGTYATALEDLLDTHGSGPEIVDRIEDDIDALDARVETIRDDLETRSSRYASDLTEIEAQANTLEEELDATESSLMSHIDSVETELSDELARLETQFDERITTVEDDIQRVRGTMLEMQAEFAAVSDAVEGLQTEVDGIKAEISEFSELRESLTEVFGAGARGDIEGQF